MDTFLYLRAGASKDGTILHENDDASHETNTNSRIATHLSAGTYTIEATTLNAGQTGNFGLVVEGLPVDMPSAPTPTPTPEPTPSPTPADPCIEPVAAATVSGTWDSSCESLERDGSYARFYTFTLDSAADVTITLTTLTSEVDTFLFIREGLSKDGDVLLENDDHDSDEFSLDSIYDSGIRARLASGTYTIEATTYKPEQRGDFTMVLGGVTQIASPTPEPTSTLVATPEPTTEPTPTAEPSPTPAATPEPTPEPIPTPETVNACVQSVEAEGTISGSWDATCLSENEAAGGPGDRYARFYTFSIDELRYISIDLSSSVDTYLYLREGHGKSGSTLHFHDDIADYGVNTDSQLTLTLTAGDYTIEATTYSPQVAGEFTLTIHGVGEDESDFCVVSVHADGTIEAAWDSNCLSEKAAEHGTGDRYARFYIFTLDAAADVTIRLESNEDAYLYLLDGHGKNGTVLHEADDIQSGLDTDSELSENLHAGDYTIEATTYNAQASGDFTLTISGLQVSP